MKRHRPVLFILILLMVMVGPATVSAQDLEEIVIKTDFGDYAAAYFPASGKEGTVFVPGARFNKESWYFLTEMLQAEQIPSIALDKISGPAIIRSIEFLHQKGCESIVLVGGSRGGGVVLNIPVHPLIEPETAQLIHKMVLLAPYGGDGASRDDISKLFVIGGKDGLSYANTMRVYEESSAPKSLKVIPDTAYHAQHLFKTEHKDELTALILDFIKH